ncbi:MAG: riboflavin synthase [Betaproteobacteria bacterium]|nr:riboflavin synthase [Betaproteobacteria bacterium]MDH5222612.1 riboflavin synthase [Betaproteobacteria bacterium]MDH5351505.1 riboflavin synthase [Betaproteobacteria bacterium]
MFTGIVQAVGKIVKVKPLVIDAGKLPLSDVKVGDSICVQGCCLTVVRKVGKRLSFDVSQETLDCTVGLDRPGPVNLEKALRLADRLGGHLVTGHVDGVGLALAVRGSVYVFRAPKAVAKYVAPKGSVCIDGVSLTVNQVQGDEFEVNLIPHTLKVTTLSRLKPGAEVNMEADLVARYVEGLTRRN